ncbi:MULTISPECIES: 50S ribosomal protein L32 [Dyadobacter]|jgi:large subunit ribosomal protein L32|uniref:Large ribosomal subunit protein bL32 n=5 Tax=Dyadobacter TaxID=120831 RepID=C6W029_DYAFD|nr:MULTISPECIES: 50S ribosomal protein L32 [Dyadobacter]ACT95356.1 ribosomal protein L32 [Dyadobacter fermentans DSM 18053]MBO9615970.1 50S ribosomal protein L32 [Dyadobacter sp.]MBZ1358437.1 50S ribosomal protein L32 [Dyadobacter fermentans]MCF0072328.1 50S ribosomal protein L32 [Dyadobacter sp. CY261]MDR6803085.1 large subunit ribosomal protein L32 [Dyadobacter fermentans]
MAHPKRRHSSTRRDSRRAHDFLTGKQLGTDATTGEIHQLHRAHVHEGNLVYRGKVVVENYTKTV